MNRFMLITGRFENAHRPDVTLQHTGKNAINLKVLENVACHNGQGFSHNTPPPVAFAEPITNFGIVAIYIIFNGKTNVSNSLAVDLNGEVVRLLIRFI